MSNETVIIDDPLERHHELAVRLLDDGYPAHSLIVCLDVLRHEPPRRKPSKTMRLLIHLLLTLRDAEADPVRARPLRSFLAGEDEVRKEVLGHVEHYLGRQSRSAAETDGEAVRVENVLRELRELTSAMSEPAPPSRTPPGVANAMYVDPDDGSGRMTRIYVRFMQREELVGPDVVGQPIEGVSDAVRAAKAYLVRAGCADSLDDLQVEVLVGYFRPLVGESMTLAVFLAAVSAYLRMPLPEDWAFTGGVRGGSFDRDGSQAAPVMPIDHLEIKLRVCAEAGVRQLMVSAHLLESDWLGGPADGCQLERVESLAPAIEKVLPQHCLPEPKAARCGEALRVFLGSVFPSPRPAPREGPVVAGSHGPHRLFLWLAPLFFAAMFTERWLVSDYLIPDFYRGVTKLPLLWAIVLGSVAGLLIALTAYAALALPDRLLDRGLVASWWQIGIFLFAVHVAAGVLVQFSLRTPFAPPPRGLYVEHRTLQWCKDWTVTFLYLVVFYVNPYTRVRLAERAAAAGRSAWARRILEGRLWTRAAMPIAVPTLLTVIAAVAIMGLGYLDWQAVLDSSRAGAGPENGPWRIIHILSKDFGYTISCFLLLAWFYSRQHQLLRAAEVSQAT